MKMFKRNRKGDLSLSVNAIVILILAIVMLGLGLTFVRGIFKKASTMINDLDPKFLINPPSADNTMTSSPISVALDGPNQNKIVQVAYYNSGAKKKYVILSQTPYPALVAWVTIGSSSGCTAVLAGEIKAWSVQIATGTPAAGATPYNYNGVVTFEVRGSDTPPAINCAGASALASTDIPILITIS